MRLHRCVVAVALIGLLSGCDLIKPKNDDPPPMPAAQPPIVAQAPTVPSVLTTVEPPKPGEVVRPELEGRADGVSGKAVTVTGAKARMQVPADWTLTKTDMDLANAPDQRSRLAITSYGADGHSNALVKAATSSGLAGCAWQPTQMFDVGKDQLSAQAADGTCTRGAAQVSAAFVATEGLLVVGSWDEGADRTGVFGSMRSITKVVVGTGTPNLIACCRKLTQNAASQADPQRGFMIQAAAACEASARANNAAGVYASLGRFGLSCK